MQVFISYKREDEAFARNLSGLLRSWGYTSWLDVEQIAPGEDWDTKIHDGLRASDVVLGILTSKSVTSANVLDEWGWALSHNKPLIPLKVQDVPESAIPPRLLHAQYIDFTKDKEAGLVHLKARLAAPTTVYQSPDVVDRNQEDKPGQWNNLGDVTSSSTELLFSMYHPHEAQVGVLYSLYIYAHLASELTAIEEDIQKFKERLGGAVPQPKTAKQSAQLKRNTPIAVVPECDEIEFGPTSLTKTWNGGWVRFDFDFRPAENLAGQTLPVRVSIQVGGVEIAHVVCSIKIMELQAQPQPATQAILKNPLATAKLNRRTVLTYQKIFVSYSRRDRQVVEAYRFAQLAIGNDVFVDTYSIRPGADWEFELANAIDNADIFQLFWSENSAVSSNVHDEWEYALFHKCPEDKCVGFIRPVYWRNPIPVPPPAELAHLNFRYVSLAVPQGILTKLELAIARVGIHLPQHTVETELPQDNRGRMLKKVYDLWVMGILRRALLESKEFKLGLELAPDAVLRHRDYGSYVLPTTEGILQVFEDMNHELLILGAPGAGKTILMLQLARQLIDQAQWNKNLPLPAVFNLSSWTADRRPLAEWLVTVLQMKYQTPKKAAQEWVENEQLLLLLDGLDKVKQEYRTTCIEAINQFKREYSTVRLVVCSRDSEYTMLAYKLDLSGAIRIKPPT